MTSTNESTRPAEMLLSAARGSFSPYTGSQGKGMQDSAPGLAFKPSHLVTILWADFTLSLLISAIYKKCFSCFDISWNLIFRVSEDVRDSLMSSGANELRDIEQTLMKHIAMELRDEDPHQFINAYTSGKDVRVHVTSARHISLEDFIQILLYLKIYY